MRALLVRIKECRPALTDACNGTRTKVTNAVSNLRRRGGGLSADLERIGQKASPLYRDGSGFARTAPNKKSAPAGVAGADF
jgi:hypothetical protein